MTIVVNGFISTFDADRLNRTEGFTHFTEDGKEKGMLSLEVWEKMTDDRWYTDPKNYIPVSVTVEIK